MSDTEKVRLLQYFKCDSRTLGYVSKSSREYNIIRDRYIASAKNVLVALLGREPTEEEVRVIIEE